MKDEGSLSVVVADEEGKKASVSIKLNATNNPPAINILKSEVDVSSTKILTIKDNSILMAEEVIATWSDDRTDANKCTVSIKYNGAEVKNGDSFRNDGTLSITVSDDEGKSSTVEIKLTATNNAPQIDVKKGEVDVSSTKTLTINDNSLLMGDEVIVIWSDDRTETDKCTVSIKYNGADVKSGDSFRNE